MQNLLLEFLQAVRDGINEVMTVKFRGRMFEAFTDLSSTAVGQRMNAAEKYNRISGMYTP